MGKATTHFKSEERKTLTEVSAFLYSLADRIAAGQVSLRQGDQEVILQLPENVTLELKAEDEQKGDRGVKHSLEIEIEWYESESGVGPVEID
jgi:amphi-Trp domain-containing protein